MNSTQLNLGYLDGKTTGAQRQNIVTIAACRLSPNTPCISGAVRGDVKNITALAMSFVDLVSPGPIVPYFWLSTGIGRETWTSTRPLPAVRFRLHLYENVKAGVGPSKNFLFIYFRSAATVARRFGRA